MPHSSAEQAFSATSPGRRLVTILMSLLLLGLSLLLALGLAELLTRYVSPQQLISRRPDIFRPDDTLGWTQRPSINTEINTGERTVRLQTDSEGYRVGVGGRVESRHKVLLIGDSFMEALQVEYEQSVAGLLERNLAKALGGPVAVRNTAVGGWDPDQYLLQLKRSIEHDTFGVAIVTLYFGNDIIDYRRERVPARQPSPVHSFRVPRALSGHELVDALLYPVNDFLEVRSHLFILAKHRLHNTLPRLGLSAVYFPNTMLRSMEAGSMWQNTVGICADMATLAKAHHLPILFVLLPDAVQVQPGLLDEELSSFRIDPETVDRDQPSRRMRKLMVARGMTVVDATDTLRMVAQRGGRLYGEVDSHLSPAGHAVVEAFVEGLLLKNFRTPGRRGR